MYKKVLKEILIWIVSIIVGVILWAPIFSKIPYQYLPLGISAIVLIIQLGRWYVQYDYVILFQKKYLKLICIALIPFISFIIWSEGQKIVALSENMDLVDLIYPNRKFTPLGYEDTYHLFAYLKNLLILCNFGTPSMALMLLFKIIYKTVGMGSNKVKTFLEVSK